EEVMYLALETTCQIPTRGERRKRRLSGRHEGRYDNKRVMSIESKNVTQRKMLRAPARVFCQNELGARLKAVREKIRQRYNPIERQNNPHDARRFNLRIGNL